MEIDAVTEAIPDDGAFMNDRADSHRPGKAILRTTRWSLVRRAVFSGDALEEWVTASWYPLYAWARHKQYRPEDAADAVQEFLGKICTRGLLGQAEPTRGKFRSWLLTGFGNHLADRRTGECRLKRGGKDARANVDFNGLEQFYQTDMAETADPQRAYTRAWALTLMDEAMARLEKHFADSGRDDLFQALLPALEGPLPHATYDDLAPGLGLSGQALRQASLRFRQRYRRLLLEVAAERLGITCEAQLGEELRELLRA